MASIFTAPNFTARIFAPALLVLVVAGCSGDDLASTSATATEGSSSGSTTDETTAGTTSPGTTVGTTQGTDSDGTTVGTSDGTTAGTSDGTTVGTSDATTTDGTTDGTTTEGTTTDGTTDGTTTDGTTTTDTDTTTGGDLCVFSGTETVWADLKDLDKKVVCGTLVFDGIINAQNGDTWELDNCPCGSQCFAEDPWTLQVMAPKPLMPELGACARIEVVTVPGFNPDVCEFQSLTIWDTSNDAKAPFYAAGRTLDYAAPPWSVTAKQLAECECDFCCNTSSAHSLTFAVGDKNVTLQEAQMGVVNAVPQVEAHNLQSHLSGICDAPPDFHWVMRESK